MRTDGPKPIQIPSAERQIMKRPSVMTIPEICAVSTEQALAQSREWQEEFLVELSGMDGQWGTQADYTVIWNHLYPEAKKQHFEEAIEEAFG